VLDGRKGVDAAVVKETEEAPGFFEKMQVQCERRDGGGFNCG
jgi:hypothetical protein